ncbi:hypothetical protein FACS1894200_10870 [Spirochaetia bacterium]|nr:hypothetical protein FACS1894200_10870 [Spirochaetia bacterium]
MKIRNRETAVAGLGDNTIPAGFNQPGFGLGTAVQVGSPNPDALLTADSAGFTPNGIDPLNKGFQLGGAVDPLAEYEPAVNNPTEWGIGGGNPSSPISSPGFPAMASSAFKEDGIGMDAYGMPIGEDDIPFAEDDPFNEDDPFAEDDIPQAFENADAIPAFEDIEEDDLGLAALPVDADGIIQPIVVPDEIIVEPELGEIPDIALPLEEPILDITEDDVDVVIPEDVFENNGMPEAIPVVESFKLPENQAVIVSKGDQIFMLGHVREEFTPKFAECVFSRALRSLAESKGKILSTFYKVGRKHEKVAFVGRSMLVEVAKDWMLPGTNTIFEAHDLLQIVSAKPMFEDEDEDEKKGEEGKSEKSKKKKEDEELEKVKKEALMARRRWKEAAKKRKEDEDDEDEDDDLDEDDDAKDEDDEKDPEKVEKKKKKERRKREAAMLRRQRTGGWI